jgi:hypothetical protein
VSLSLVTRGFRVSHVYGLSAGPLWTSMALQQSTIVSVTTIVTSMFRVPKLFKEDESVL